MMDDVITLIKSTYTVDEYGNSVPEETRREVYCQLRSVTRSEFYQAAQTELHPEQIFILHTYLDYKGETDIEYADHAGKVRRYSVIRTYRLPETDELEITATERVGDQEDE